MQPQTPPSQDPTPSQPTRPPKIGRPGGLARSVKPAPDDVRWGMWCWLSVSSMQVLLAVVTFVSNLVDRRALRQQVAEQVKSNGPLGAGLPKGMSVDSLTTAINGTMLGWSVVIAAICAYLTFRAGRGGVYSRLFLNIASGYLILSAIFLLFSSAPATTPVGFVLLTGIITILSAVAAGLGMYFMSRPGNADWFGIPSAAEMERYANAVEAQRRQRQQERQDKRQEKQQDKRQGHHRPEHRQQPQQSPPYPQGPAPVPGPRPTSGRNPKPTSGHNPGPGPGDVTPPSGGKHHRRE
ncbi:hypothetical protein CHEID_09335 [Corynebacterium heidelbergense]|nr:hypothetical protein [Corynebacterium heidelbergense]WCZ37393.1 hypothetical protein CHEID_09335 [Corynebacterium heidelbergense]